MAQPNSEDGYRIIRGHTFPKPPHYSTEINVEECIDYMPHDGDIITASYPKTGSTWLHYIVMLIVSKGEMFPNMKDTLLKIAPMMEFVGVKVIEDLKKPRCYRHHMPYDIVKKNPNSKYLYIYRNPEDTLVSYYHYYKEQHADGNLDFEQFFEMFLSGKINHGSYFKHVKSFLDHKNDESLHMISYENLKTNQKEEVLKLAKFLGEEYYQNIMNDSSVLDTILEKTSFQYMHGNLNWEFAKGFDINGKIAKVNFFRKGIIGDGKQFLSVLQRKRLQEKTKQEMIGTDIYDEWMAYYK